MLSRLASPVLKTSLLRQSLQARLCCPRPSLTTRSMSKDAPLPTAPEKVKIALCQLLTTADKEKNIQTAREAIKTAAANGAKLVVLPEMFNCPYANESFPVYAEDIDGGNCPSVDALAQAAQQSSVTLVGGSLPERSQGKLYNTCCVFDTKGKLLARHRKTHLFDIDIPGKITFKESTNLSPGDSLTVVDTEVGRLGIGICYDLRFPEFSMVYAQQGCQLLLFPAAFNMTTGPVHWELLAKARAIDNQIFVALCSPARNPPGAGYQAWGHSTAVGPFAEVLATCDEQPTIVYADLDFTQIPERRRNMPIRAQKRFDLYSQVEAVGR
uniref:CN hydrolase domain-containing protein n=1 Tax=Dunaliella tertiolecta TaxID=3047 RepID=A0A7S3R7Z1_DUNTE|mmetsp:Transcript_22532/g.62253  ORF Transcript_22532/g.62253 Transcript_22532/m.62253 type:complete len:326 (+) Transcript_22532:84-1061(+)